MLQAFWSIMNTAVAPMLTGVVWGAVFHLCRIDDPRFIRSQFNFTHFVMIKLFISALACSLSVLTLLSQSPRFSAQYQLLQKNVSTGLPRGWLFLVGGGLLIGVGMALSGSCPGTVYSQLGSAPVASGAVYTFAGGLLGALLFGLVDGIWDDEWDQLQRKGDFEDPDNAMLLHTLKLRVSPANFAFAISLSLMALVCIIEWLVPWRNDLFPDVQGFVLHPIIGGVMLGLLQLLLYTFVGQHLGTSSSYVCVCANLFSRLPPFCYSKHYKAFARFGWQVCMMSGLVLGSYLTSIYAPTTSIELSKHIPPSVSFLGGVLLIFGARMAGGCTSGHGISGASYLSTKSVLVLCAMFGGAICTLNLLGLPTASTSIATLSA